MIPRESSSEDYNSEQDDEGQAPDIEALRREGGDIEIEESEHGSGNDPADVIPDDIPDLVDRMTGMVRSGHIDMDAYAGEPIHDDEEGMYGDTGDDEVDE